MQCKARYCREKKELKFRLRSGYFTELRCPNLAATDGPDTELCTRCQIKASKPFRIPCQQGQYQGKIDEPYFEGSWIFGSERFHELNKKPGNAISDEDYARAEAAQRIARQGSEMKAKSEPKIKPVAQKKVSKSKSSETPAAQLKNIVVLPAKPVGLPPIGVVLLDEPLEAAEVIRVKVKKVILHETAFWKDSENNVYQMNKDNGVGKRQGLWNEDEETLEPDFLRVSEDE